MSGKLRKLLLAFKFWYIAKHGLCRERKVQAVPLISVQLWFTESLDSNFLKRDNDKTDEHVEQDQCHDAHEEKEVDECIGRGVWAGPLWVIGVLKDLRIVSIVHHSVEKHVKREIGEY